MTTGSEKLLLIREKYELVELVVNSEEVLDRSRQRAKGKEGKAFFDGRWLSHVELASPIYLRDRSVAQTSRAFYSGCLYGEACFTCLICVSSDI